MMVQLKGQQRKGQGAAQGLSMVKPKPLYLSCRSVTACGRWNSTRVWRYMELRAVSSELLLAMQNCSDDNKWLYSRLIDLTMQCYRYCTDNALH